MATKLEGVDYVLTNERTATYKRKRRKPTLDELMRTKALLDKTQAESDAVRAKTGLDPVPPNFYRVALIDAIAAEEAKAGPAMAPAKTVRATDWRKIATAALDVLGLSAPKRPEDVQRVMAALG